MKYVEDRKIQIRNLNTFKGYNKAVIRKKIPGLGKLYFVSECEN